MIVSLKLPRFGMTMEEATVVKWYRQPGEGFKTGEPLYEIETEKVTTTVEAPCDGRMVAIVATEPRLRWKAYIAVRSMSESPSPDMTKNGPSLKNPSTFLMAPAVPNSFVSKEYCSLRLHRDPSPQ